MQTRQVTAYTNVNQKDFKIDIVADVRNIMEGDTCPCCGGKIEFKHGIEVGNTFKLGTKYSKAMGLQYLDFNNQLQDVRWDPMVLVLLEQWLHL